MEDGGTKLHVPPVELQSQKPFHFVEVLTKLLQGLVDRVGRGDIDTRALQQVDRVVTAAAAEEVEVAVYGGLAFVQDLLRQSNCRRDTGGVLVDVETSIKVGNASPFYLYLLLHVDVP